MKKMYGFKVTRWKESPTVITTLYESEESAEENRAELETGYIDVELIEFDVQEDD